MAGTTIAALLAATALGAGTDGATATYAHSTLRLTLRYEMTCGQPGPGPLVVRLPATFGARAVRTVVDGNVRSHTTAGPTLNVSLPEPPQITCMSIAMGSLNVRIAGLRAPAGTWTVGARIRTHAFAARLRIR